MSSNVPYCTAFLEEGCVLGPRCELRHDIRKCPCGLVVRVKDLQSHQRGQKHLKLLQRLLRASAAANTSNAPVLPVPPVVRPPPPVPERQQQCGKCRRIFPASEMGAHAEEHLRQERFRAAEAAFAEAEENKGGVTVTKLEGVDFGVVEEDGAAGTDVMISKSGPNSIRLDNFCMRSSTRNDGHGERFSATLIGSARSRWLKNDTPRTVVIVFHPSYAGQYEDNLELIFIDTVQKRRFVITRRVHAVVGSKEDHETLKPKSPYVKKKYVPFNLDGHIVRSLRPPTWTATKWASRLLEYLPPADLIKAAYPVHDRGPNIIQNSVKRFMPKVFNDATYAQFFQTLLYIEEERMKRDLDHYSMQAADVVPNHPRYDLKVKGLEEGRPSVLVGDYILVSHSSEAEDTTDRRWYEGRVHKVYQKHVSLAFSDDFSTYKGRKFDVRFVLNRLPIRRQHQALSNAFRPTRFLFPGPEHIRTARKVTAAEQRSITPIYRPLGSDEEQMETVAAIVHLRPGSVPFILFGPPGTGKTVTMVEAIQQLLLRDPNVRILACAPSNSAADLIAQKLVTLGPSQLFRMNAQSRKASDLPKSLKKFSLLNGNMVFVVPELEELQKYRVVVSTCISGGIPAGLGLKRGHFSHIFIDEAGQGTEPCLMIPIKGMASDTTNLILAGDNQQLGPVVSSPLASQLGLKKSYLARLMDRDIYDLKKGGRGVTIVKLVKNFRSHPDILKFANEEFYNSELKPCGDPALTRSLERDNELPKKGFPLVFHGIIGRDEREESSPSFFNADEAALVKKYCLSLITDRKNGIRAEHIGVITPYHAQRCKILDLFHKDNKLHDIKVGSVEEFQGQERRIIIISTVRSSTNYLTSDIRRSLGFVANARRFNVAITRAQAMLIVVGNPIVLSLDPLWRGFMNYIHINGGWRGKGIDWNPEETAAPGVDGSHITERRNQEERKVSETLERLKAMIIKTHDDSDYEVDLSDDSDSEPDNDPTDMPMVTRDAE